MFENKIDKCDNQKSEIDTYRPLPPDQSKALNEHFKIGLTYSSNALEGNTLSLIETKVIIEDGLTIGGKSLNEIDEATGHARAYDFIFELVANDKITLADILKIHKLFYQYIDPDNVGSYRTKTVFISGMDVTPPDPAKIESLMQNRVDYIAAAYAGNKGNDEPFVNMLSCMVYESQKEYLKLLKL